MFAERLKALRKESGLTQTQFAAEMSVAGGTVAMWETGKREPNFDTLLRIADYFGVSLDYLLGRIQKENLPTDLVDSGYTEVVKSGPAALTEQEIEVLKRFARQLRD